MLHLTISVYSALEAPSRVAKLGVIVILYGAISTPLRLQCTTPVDLSSGHLLSLLPVFIPISSLRPSTVLIIKEIVLRIPHIGGTILFVYLHRFFATIPIFRFDIL